MWERLSFQVLTGPPRTAGAERTVVVMDNRGEIRDFLTSRRARITPEQAGLPAYGSTRRVTGLRREEVALLAGVSVDYYTRLERGNARGAPDTVLDTLARALQLDEAERAHLLDLARATNAINAARASRRPAGPQVRPAVQRILDSMAATPAYLRNGRMDILGANQLGRALYAPVFDSSAPANHARFIFLDPGARNSSPTGTARPATRWPCCAPRQAATRTTAHCPTSSASFRPAANPSGSCGRRTTCGSTAPASNASTTRSSATSPWRSKPSTSPRTGCGSPPTLPNPAPHRPTR
jgi:transcriptional regulator with XRE-family HTH domain